MKDNLFFSIIFTCFFLCFVSCREAKDDTVLFLDQKLGAIEEFSNSEASFLSVLLNPNKSLSLEDALDNWTDYSISFTQGTRNVHTSIESTILSKRDLYEGRISDSLYCLLPDTIAYIVSSGDAFSVLPADLRFGNSVIFEAQKENFSDIHAIEDITSAFVFDNVAEYLLNSFIAYCNQEASLSAIVIDKFNKKIQESANKEITRAKQKPYVVSSTLINTFSTNWVTTNRVDALVPVTWNQGSPYNREAAYYHGEGVQAGCVAVGVAHILSRWRWPSTIGSMYIHWNDVCRNSQIDSCDTTFISSEVSHVMWTIGNEIGMNYSTDGSGADTADGRDWLLNLGYIGGTEMGYSYSDVVSSLNNGCPVLARGDRTFYYIEILGQKIGYTTNGHCWVIDGCLNRYRVLQDLYEATYSDGTEDYLTMLRYEYANYQHCNWGWGGNCNGWFPEGCFDSQSYFGTFDSSSDEYYEDRNSFYYPSPGSDLPGFDKDEEGINRNYQYNKKIYVNLRPGI